MRALLKNKLDRIVQKKAIVFIALVIMPLMVIVAIFFSRGTTIQETIGYVGEATNLPISDQFAVVPLAEMPATSKLVDGTYVAVVSSNADGSYNITSLKGETDILAIKSLFETGKLPADYKGEDALRNERGVGTNILGFITMLVLMQGAAITELYPEDRNTGMFRRIMTTRAGTGSYLAAQAVFTFIALYVPTYAAIVLAKVFLGAELGFSLGMLAILLFILVSLATAFALFISTMLSRNINLATTGISIVTCILAGCFVPLASGNRILTVISNILPQSAYMDIVHSLEFGGSFMAHGWQLFYLAAITLLLGAVAILTMKSRTKKGIY